MRLLSYAEPATPPVVVEMTQSELRALLRLVGATTDSQFAALPRLLQESGDNQCATPWEVFNGLYDVAKQVGVAT